MNILFQYSWIPLLFAYYCIFYWMSKKNNDLGGHWFWVVYIFGAICPFWVIVSRISKNLILDGLIYDLTMFSSFIGTMIYLGAGAKFNIFQWIGLAFIIVGFVVMRSQVK